MNNHLITCMVLILLSACQDSTQSSTVTDKISDTQNTEIKDGNTSLHDDVIAIYTNGKITRKELESAILALPVKQRWSTENPKQWYKDLIRKIVIEKTILTEARLIGMENDIDFQFKKHELLRISYSNQFINEHKDKTIYNEEELEQYYQDNKSRFDMPEQRVVYHIFKSSIKNPAEKAKKEITKLRQRTMNGESFMLVSEKYSDSETRHHKGMLGTLERGDMSDDFDSVVFALKKDVPSDVIKTSSGYHVFYVTDILKQTKFTYEQIKNILRKELVEKKTQEFIKKIALQLPKIEPMIIAEAEQLPQLLRQGNVKIIEVGDFTLNSQQFLLSVTELLKFNLNKNKLELMQEYLQDTAYREIIYQSMLRENSKFKQPDLLDRQLDLMLIKEFSKSKIRSYINHHSELVKQYYSENKMRFSTPIKLNIQELIIPRDKNKNLMPELEAIVTRLDNGDLNLEELSKKYNGKLVIMGLKTINQISQIDQKILKFAPLLNVNEHSAPFTSVKFYFIIKLLEKQEAQIRPFSIVREQVVAEYSKNNEAFVFNEISKEILADVVIDDEKLDAIIASLYKN